MASLTRGEWTALPRDPSGPRQGAIVAWTGHELLAVGGALGGVAATAQAAAYDPATARWTMLPDFPLPSRVAAASTWTGEGLLVWGGMTTPNGRPQDGSAVSDGAILDVVHRQWHVLPASPLPAVTLPVAVVAGGGEVIILGGHPAQPLNRGPAADLVSRRVAAYDPHRDSWRTLPPMPTVRDHDLVDVQAVGWGSDVLVQATWEHVVQLGIGSTSGTGGVDLFRLDPVTNRWSRLAVSSSVPLVGADLQPFGALLVVAAGSNCPPGASCPARLFDAFELLDGKGRPAANIAVPPITRRVSTAVGNNYVITSGSQISGPGRDEQPGDTAGFDVSTRRWITLPSARRFHPDPQSLIWTGNQLILWSPTGPLSLVG